MSQQYQYTPLPTSTSIRLLTIESIQDVDSIKCALQTIDLAATTPEQTYTALSYTWKSPLFTSLTPAQKERDMDAEDIKGKTKISIDGREARVGSNLKEALLQLGKREVGAMFWIDALCINQGNVEERSEQVAMMGKIYARAQQVVIWLGPADYYLQDALPLLKILSAIPDSRLDSETNGHGEVPENLDDERLYRMLGIERIGTEGWKALATFLLRKWFSRVWVVQEIFAAGMVVVWVGEEVVDWDVIVRVGIVLIRSGIGRLLLEKVEELEPEFQELETEREGKKGREGNEDEEELENGYLGNNVNNMVIFEELRRRKSVAHGKERLSLENLVSYSRYFSATDLKDHVYGVMGMWFPAARIGDEEREFIKPNYMDGVTAKDVYTRATLVMMREMGDLNVFSCVEDASIRKLKKKLPSWVPDFSVTPIAAPLWGEIGTRKVGEEMRWNASKTLRFEVPELRVGEDMARLKIKGVRIDCFAESAKTWGEITDEHKMFTLLKVLKHAIEEEPARTSDLIEGWWKTLLKDTFLGKPAGEEARRAFPALLTDFVKELRDELEILKNGQDKEAEELELLYSQTERLVSELSALDISGIIPGWNWMQDIIRQHDNGILPLQVDQDSENAGASLRAAYLGRRLFRTKRNRFGLGPQSMDNGDEVWILAGANVPMMLRQLGNGCWKLVGEVYAYGCMDGEAVESTGGGEIMKIILK